MQESREDERVVGLTRKRIWAVILWMAEHDDSGVSRDPEFQSPGSCSRGGRATTAWVGRNRSPSIHRTASGHIRGTNSTDRRSPHALIIPLMQIQDLPTFLDYFDKIHQRTMRVARCIPADQIEWT